ncbi:MAG: hypothetical protein CMH56_13630 [Myxococcales bacterium]|nr:hypothetical protein [Myxococcales bacterium]
MGSGASAHALDLQQKANPQNRAFENLPQLNLIRGAQLKDIPLEITAEGDWTLSANKSWAQLDATSGNGNQTVVLRIDEQALTSLDDATATLTLSAPGSDDVALEVDIDIWPKIPPADATPAQLRDFVKNRDNWPSDGSFPRMWELWGFLPDQETHPDTASGANMDAWEKVACDDGTASEDCVREGQAGLHSGMAADQAWLLSTGDPRVRVAVLDSGIKWGEKNLTTKHYLNPEELRVCPPPGGDLNAEPLATGFDVNGDGLFNIRDYDEATWITDVNANGHHDPQDLIWSTFTDGTPCSDGIDDDVNGYMDDISGWDFFWNDNDPSDDTQYGHGTGEANDSTGEPHDGRGMIGICPRCTVLNLRVGDSFVVDANKFAEAVVYAADNEAKVVQEALGSVNNTPYAQSAINYAYNKGTAIIASAADENSYHHNYPGNADHTFYVHNIVADTDGDYENAATFLNYGNCSNHGGHLMLSTPGTGCSSEATGNTSGQAGLLYSYFLQLQDAATGDEASYFEAPLSAEELYQVMVASADDIDIPGMETDEEALAALRFPSNEGWDQHFGYGRNNVRRSLERLRDQLIPPEADILRPRWFQTIDPSRQDQLAVIGSVGSPRLTDLKWTLSVAEGPTPTADAFVTFASGEGTSKDEELAVLDLTTDGPLGGLVERANDKVTGYPEQYTAVILLQVTGTSPVGEVTGRFRKTFHLRQDDDMMKGFPLYLDASGESSPKVADIDGDGKMEIILATADGRVHAIDHNASELPGFPLETPIIGPLNDDVCAVSPAQCHQNAPAYQADSPLAPEKLRESVTATVALGDLNGDGNDEKDIVVFTFDGSVMVWDNEGNLFDGFPVHLDKSKVSEFEGALRCENDAGEEIIGCMSKQRFAESGFHASPVLYDLDSDGDLEIIGAAMDQWIYAWHHDGELVTGWPVHLQDSRVPPFDDAGEIRRYDGRIISTPAVGDIFGDGTPIVLVGTNERFENDTNSRLYAIYPEGNSRSGGAFPDGWPAFVTGFIPDEILPFLGRGNPNSPAVVDFDNDGMDDVIVSGLGGVMTILDNQGRTKAMMESSGYYYGDNSNVDEPLGSLPIVNNPSVGDLDGDGRMELINGTAGLGLVQIASNGGLRAEFDHSVSAWVAENGLFHEGFPHKVHDYQFFMNYVVADLVGDGKWHVVFGDGGYYVYAPDYQGHEAPGFPKFTGQWHISTPAVGDVNGDGRIDVVAPTREGWLFVWEAQGAVGGYEKHPHPAIQWGSFHHDDQNTGNMTTPLHEYPRVAEQQPPEEEEGCGCQTTHTSPFNALWLLPLFLIRRRRE